MSLKPAPIPPVPEETARVARAVFPRGNVLMQVRDTLGTMYSDEVFADLFPTHGQPAEAPWRLALVTGFQFMEHLTDRQATDAVRSRLLWKGDSWAWTANVVFILIHIVADIGFVASRSFAIDKVIGLAVIVSMLGF